VINIINSNSFFEFMSWDNFKQQSMFMFDLPLFDLKIKIGAN
jgi:hypothetical protein